MSDQNSTDLNQEEPSVVEGKEDHWAPIDVGGEDVPPSYLLEIQEIHMPEPLEIQADPPEPSPSATAPQDGALEIYSSHPVSKASPHIESPLVSMPPSDILALEMTSKMPSFPIPPPTPGFEHTPETPQSSQPSIVSQPPYQPPAFSALLPQAAVSH